MRCEAIIIVSLKVDIFYGYGYNTFCFFFVVRILGFVFSCFFICVAVLFFVVIALGVTFGI